MPLNVLAGLLSLAALSLFLGWFFRRPAGLMPLVAVSCAMLFFTLMGCLGLLQAAGWLWYALCGAALAVVVIRLKSGWVRLVTPAFALFVAGAALMILLFALTRPMLTLWDEFTFWGTAGKVTRESGQLYTVARSGLIARAYPPGLIVFSYAMQFFGEFSEHGFIASFAVVYLSAFAAAVSVWGKNRSASVVFMAAMAALPLLFETASDQVWYAYLACMADTPMAVFFGGALCFYFAGGEKGGRLMLPFGLILGALVNLKDMGLALALCALAVAALDMFFCERERLRFLRLRRGAALAAACGWCLGVIAATYALWSWHLGTEVAINRFDVGSKGESLDQLTMLITGVRMLLGFGRSEQFQLVLNKMLRALWHERIFLPGSGAAALALILAISLAAWLLGATRRQRRRVLVFTLSMAGGFAAFYVFNIFTYALIFRPVEAETLREYARYISPFWLAWLMGALVLLGRAATYHKATFYRRRCARAVSAALCMALLAVLAAMGNWNANFLRVSPSLYGRRLDVKKIAAAALAEGERAQDTIYILSQDDDGTRFYMLGYELRGVRVPMFVGLQRDELGGLVYDTEGRAVVFGEAASTLVPPGQARGGPFDMECSPEEWLIYLKRMGCTHVLLDVLDAYILRDFAPLFSDGLRGWDGLGRGHSYYRIEWDGEGSALLVPQLMPEGGAAL